MRTIALALVAGCFNPKLAAHLQCEAPDNWCPPPMTCSSGFCTGGDDAAGDAFPQGNFVFLSSQTIATAPGATVGVVQGAGDAMCQMLGQKLRPGGTYVAAIGTPLTATITQVTSRITATTGWVRYDGKPFAASHNDLDAGNILYPMRFDDDGGDVTTLPPFEYPQVLTALDSTCGSLSVGSPDGDGPAWLHTDASGCGNSVYVYCFETDRTTPVAPPTFEPTLLVGFVTDAMYSLDGGIASLDAHCQHEADVAGILRTFRAFVAPDGATARSRFVNTNNRAWQRLDGVIFADPDLKSFSAPLDMTPSRAKVDGSAAYGSTGFTIAGDAATGTCSNWGSLSGTPYSGFTTRSNNIAIFGGSAVCSGAHLYCLEVP